MPAKLVVDPSRDQGKNREMKSVPHALEQAPCSAGGRTVRVRPTSAGGRNRRDRADSSEGWIRWKVSSFGSPMEINSLLTNHINRANNLYSG